jgi:signal transduction histidine kinase
MQIRPLVRRLFPPPAWLGQDEDSRIAGLASDLIGMTVVFVLLAYVIILSAGYTRSNVTPAVALVTTLSLELMRRRLQRGRRVRLVVLSSAVVTVLPSLLLYWVTVRIGVAQGGTLLVGVTFCAVTLGFRAAAWLSVLALGAYGVLGWSLLHWQVAPKLVVHPFNEFVTLTMLLLLLLLGTTLVRQDLDDLRERSVRLEQDALREREARLQVVQAQADQLEARVEERTRELQRSARDMGLIVQSVSHDLRTPVLAMAGYADVLAQRHPMDERGQQVVARIGRNARWLLSMLDRLLDYTRAQALDWQPGLVPLDSVVADVATDLQVRWPQVRFVLEPLGPVRGDEMMLRQVFDNLLGNACKFSARVAEPVVEVRRSERPDGVPVFEVADNGPGFQPDQAERLFDLFHRAHGAQEFEGSGVGLAIVRRLVEQHGGQVQASLRPQGGAVIAFTLGRQARTDGGSRRGAQATTA